MRLPDSFQEVNVLCATEIKTARIVKTGTNFSHFYPSWLSVAVMNIMTKKQLGEERVDVAYMSPSVHDGGKPRQELKQTMEEQCLLVCFPLLIQPACFCTA